jgi:hypothetical protein
VLKREDSPGTGPKDGFARTCADEGEVTGAQVVRAAAETRAQRRWIEEKI